MVLILLLLLNTVGHLLAEDAPVVGLPEGSIRGLVATSVRYHTKFYAYLGIPYAAKPIGNLRFQPPQSPPRWSGVFEAKSNNKICYQTQSDNSNASEDCLYINVYTPVKPGTGSSLPVIVNIYGGAFINGAANPGTRMPEYVMEKGGIIVVTLNYRVGPFGFLSTGDTVIPGNMGLKDQNFALKWVQKNIHLFGGDPHKVTIMGQSAGSASVTYHLLSPMSAGLFRGAIGESGSALCTWAHQRHAVDTAYGIAAILHPGFSKSHSTTELKNILMSASAEAIHKTASKYSIFSPVVEVKHSGAFITESMYDAVLHGRVNKVPVVMGFNSEEALYMAQNMASVKNTASNYDRFLYKLIDEDMNIKDQNVATNVGGLVKNVYVGNGHFVDNLGKTIQYNSDNRYIRPVIRFAELYSAYERLYFYEFSYHGKLGNNPYNVPGAERVEHAEELRYFWTVASTLNGMPAEDIKTLDRFVGLLTNFVKNLNPTPQKDALFENVIWQPMSRSQMHYLDINKDLSLKMNPRSTYRSWVTIYEKYAQSPRISY